MSFTSGHRAATFIAFFLCFCTTFCVSAPQGSGFLVKQSHGLEKRVADALQSLLQASSRLDKIEASMFRSSQALPTNGHGRLDHQGVRYLVHAYFAQTHGWLIKGLGHQGPRTNLTEIHNASILQDKAPVLLEALLDAKGAALGLTLRDAASMAATLERLIVDESLALVEASYVLNGIRTDSKIDGNALREVLMSFLVLWELGGASELAESNTLADPWTHLMLKEQLEETIGTSDDFWERLDLFQLNAVQNLVFRQRHTLNSFSEEPFSFETSSELAETLSHSYGEWQNEECRMMKAQLMGLDRRGFGRVPLSVFYSQPETSIYKFGESVEYLRAIGALDETHAQEPHVLISNYVAGPSNCIAGSEYYSVCCLNECGGLMSELEGQVRAPTVAPEVLFDLVSKLSSSTVDAPRQLPQTMVKRLQDIANQHDGEVPLHGRLFAQWLHYAFPLECQYPLAPESDDVMSPSHWEERGHSATAEDKEKFIALAASASDSAIPMEDQDLLPVWSDEEFLPFHGSRSFKLPSARVVARCAVQFLMLFAALRGAYQVWSSAANVDKPNLDKKNFEQHYNSEKAHFV